MRRGDGERRALRTLLDGSVWAATGTSESMSQDSSLSVSDA
jgi:hypothetical protein